MIPSRTERGGVIELSPGILPPVPRPSGRDRFGREVEPPAETPRLGMRPTLIFSAEASTSVNGKVLAALDLYRIYDAQFTEEQRRIFALLKTINVANRPTSVDVFAGVFDLSTGYVEQSTALWLASAFAHDAYHVYQYTADLAAWAKRELLASELAACQFQLEIGRIIGLSAEHQQSLEDWISGKVPYPVLQYA